ncbi:MAG: hypothetical protein ORN23_00960, partial [Chthoniobacterales bacterium]|nr:hypothetical protein [Chthoniobacterales bacterium]
PGLQSTQQQSTTSTNQYHPNFSFDVSQLWGQVTNNAKIERLREQSALLHCKESCLAYVKAYVESYFCGDVSPIKTILEAPEISNETRTLIISEISPR